MISRVDSEARAPVGSTDLEAYRVLVSMAERRFGAVPAEFIAHHVLRVTDGADWPVQEEALRALIRRRSFARRDELRVRTRPPRGAPFGEYVLARKRHKARPYRTVLESLEPLRGSCNCPDYLRGSLGLCKHLLTVLDTLAASERRWKRALEADPRDAVRKSAPLVWDPVRELRGPGDWLSQVRWDPRAATPGRTPAAEVAARRRFRVANDLGELRDTHADRPARRLELVRSLERCLAGPRRSGSDDNDAAAIVDPALQALLADELARLERIGRQRANAPTLLGELRALRVPLYPYQREGTRRFLEDGRLLLADEMGLGKTAQAIACGHALLRRRRIRRGLVIAPAPLKSQWLREWQHFSRTPVSVVDGPPDARAACYESQDRGFLIINYEQLLRDLHRVKDWAPDLVILDEAQRIKNWATKTAAAVKAIRPPYRLVLTGTPLENRLEELASIVEWVDDRALEPKWRLGPWHRLPADDHGRAGGARNLDTLRARLSGLLLRRRRTEVLEQLPSRTDTIVPVAMTPAQQAAHADLDRPIARLAHAARRRPLTPAEFQRLMQLLTTQRVISNGLAQVDFQEVWPDLEGRRPTERRLRALDSPKLIELRELSAQLLEQDRKFVVFSQWRRALRLAHWAIHDLLTGRGERAAFFTGRESPARRTENIVDFHDDPTVRVLFASDAGGTGLNLQRAANCVVNLELPWNPAVLEQRIGRIYRIGQKRPIDVYNLLCESGIETRITTLVSDKMALFDGLFDGVTNEILYDDASSFLDRLQRLLPRETRPEAAELHDVAADDGLDEDLDDPLDGAVDPTVTAADESGDGEAEPAGTATAPGASTAHERGDWHQEIAGLFDGLELRRLDDGTLRIEARKDAAAALEAVLQGLATLLREAQSPSREEPR